MPRASASALLVLLATTTSTMGFELWLDWRSSTTAAASSLSSDVAAIFDRQIVDDDNRAAALNNGAAAIRCQQTGQLRAMDDDALIGAAVAVGSADKQSDALALVGSVEWILAETDGGAPMITACARVRPI